MKQILKNILNSLHISLTKNQRYDEYTRKILKRVLKPGSNAIDVGCHLGEILDLMIKSSPEGKKFAFEPIPEFYTHLVKKYSNDPLVAIKQVALYDKTGNTTFQHVVNEPAYSGIKKRRYDGKQVNIRQITVATDLLDRLIPGDIPIDFIKIDVEGAELAVMRGGVNTIRRCRPVIIFECGLGASDFYGTKPEWVFQLLTKECSLKISTLPKFLHNGESLQEKEFSDLFYTEKEYYFVAHP
ncbi:MAG: FkbM family methyltransferase [bacterium]